MKRLILVLILLIATDMVFAQGCSQCKLLAEQGAALDESSFGTTINKGILYLMAMPYIIIAIVFRKRIVSFFRGLFSKA